MNKKLRKELGVKTLKRKGLSYINRGEMIKSSRSKVAEVQRPRESIVPTFQDYVPPGYELSRFPSRWQRFKEWLEKLIFNNYYE